VRTPHVVLGAGLLIAFVAGCASTPHPQQASAPQTARPDPQTGFTRIVSGAGDSVGAIPGSATAQYAYRFRQIEPGSDRFTYQNRDLSFYFRPSPSALYIQVENRQNKTVWIDWDRSTWVGTFGNEKIAHGPTRWTDRYSTQPATQILGLQRYTDYMFPISLLVDPSGSGEQLHRTFLPEDNTALQYVDRVFGVDLVFRVDNANVPYSFRFKVASAVPR